VGAASVETIETEDKEISVNSSKKRPDKVGWVASKDRKALQATRTGSNPKTNQSGGRKDLLKSRLADETPYPRRDRNLKDRLSEQRDTEQSAW